MPLNSRKKRLMAEINVVPYVDVMLVLLVIFMITVPLLSQGVKVKLPQAPAQALSAKQSEPIIVSIDAKGHYFLNVAKQPNQPLTAATLVTQVATDLQIAKHAGQQRQILVKGDRDVSYGKVVQIMVWLQHAGAANIGLMTEGTRPK